MKYDGTERSYMRRVIAAESVPVKKPKKDTKVDTELNPYGDANGDFI